MKPDLRARALSCLARREYSRQELRRKLAPHAEDAGTLDTLLDELQTRGWLSEARFVEQILHARQGKYGMQRIAHELREKGVAEALIEEVLPQIKETELETARAVWAKKFGALPQDAKERARQMRFLQSRGFSLDVIGKVLRCSEE
ncbi:MAG: recombination regulator RecX [Pseudomonadota bacterium]